MNRRVPSQTGRTMRTRRTNFAVALAVVALMTGASSVVAQESTPTGTYDSTFEEVTNNCGQTRMNLDKGKVELRAGKGTSMSVVVPMVPVMSGSFSKGGKFNAKVKKGPTTIRGVDGKFSAAGRVENGELSMVFVAEFYSGNKPLCTQSWKVAGKR